ncbi:glucosaminidase domain-containing protein [Burkholderia multivorans]|uniref:glucosaminidase domain-containing protein n=1 Tax=Burkholderia multivorans TaxID=87883 RepID=UPI0002781B37|nr:glucosaminidase domain-containing protein [Burkholderia multivorans]EJO57350.1 mannosyl-glycoprotein endo-beta-N-acetylglucosaminidase [Burkholderia multivorans CF2]MBU9472103.1 glucosaminidase domain-containing protein [Burkholderia multivorans]
MANSGITWGPVMAGTGITWGPASSASSGSSSSSGGITWGDNAQVGTPQGFAQTYGSTINNIAGQLNVDPSIIAGQLGLETGYGKSVIPGTNNLGNIKSTNGQGVSAVDNQTGSTDTYNAYPDADAFASNYVNLIKNKYPKAVGAQNAQQYATALKAGGYAQDPNYVGKVSKAAQVMSSILGAATGSTNANADEAPTPSTDAADSFIKQFGNPSLAGSNKQNSSGANGDPADNFIQQYGLPTAASAPGTTDASKAQVTKIKTGNNGSSLLNNMFGAGLADGTEMPNVIGTTTNPIAMGARDAVYNAVEPVVGWLSKAANWVDPDSEFAKKAAQGVKDLQSTNAAQQQAYNSVQHSGAGNFVRGATGFAGDVATHPFLAGSSVPSVIAQSAWQGLESNPDNPLAGTAAGAAGGVAGAALGNVAGRVMNKLAGAGKALAQAGNDFANAGTATGQALSPEEMQMAARVADKINNTADQTGQNVGHVADELSINGSSVVPGYQKTAAEATQNPVIQGAQQGLDSSGVNSGLTARSQANANANTAHLQSLGGDDATISALGKQADQQAAWGNQEIGPVASQEPFSTPAMQRTLSRANTLANNDGSSVVQSVLDRPNTEAANQWGNIAGTPQQTANFELERKITTGPMYQQIFENGGPKIALDPETARLINTPAMQNALKQVETNKLNARIDEPVIQNMQAVSPDGSVYGQSISANDLNQARMALDKRIAMISADPSSADKFQLATLAGLRDQVNATLENQVPGLRQANQAYQTASEQMAESKFLTNQNMTDALGRLNLNKLDALVKEIQAGKANLNEHDPAKLVSNAKLAQLTRMRDDLAAMAKTNNAVGLQGQGYNYLRQAAQTDPEAAAQVKQYLTQKSPNYQNFYTTQEQLAQHENYQKLLQKFDTRADGNVAWNDVKNLGTQANHFTSEQLQGLQAVRANLEANANKTAKVRGSNTASNLASRDGLDKLAATDSAKPGIAKYLGTEAGERAMRTIGDAALGHLTTKIGAAHGGPVGAMAGYAIDKTVGAIARKFGSKSADQIAEEVAANKQALENLMLNPQRLSDALKAAEANKEVVDGIKQNLQSSIVGKQKIGGLLGALAGSNAYKGLNNQ